MNDKFIITNINRVALVDKNEYPDKITVFSRILKHNELIFHFSGESLVYFNDKVLETKSNAIRFLPYGDNKKYVVERKTHGECIFVVFDTDRKICDEAFVLNKKNNAHIGALFKKMFAVWATKSDGYYFETMSILYKILSEIQKDNYIPDNQYKKIRPAIEYIENHFLDEKISVAHLAKICGISESYLKRLFIKKFAVPPSNYIIQMKINFASDLLRANEHTISEISDICGYSGIHFFTRQFRKYTGVTPTEFKNKYKSSK